MVNSLFRFEAGSKQAGWLIRLARLRATNLHAFNNKKTEREGPLCQRSDHFHLNDGVAQRVGQLESDHIDPLAKRGHWETLAVTSGDGLFLMAE